MGGAEYRCKLIIDELYKYKIFDIYYLCRNSHPDYKNKKYKIITFGTKLGSYGRYFDSFDLYKLLKKISPDIIYQNGGSPYTGIAYWYAKKFKKKLVHQICNDKSLLNLHKNRFKKSINIKIENLFFLYGLRNAGSIVGQSNNQNELLYNLIGRKCDLILRLGHPIPDEQIFKCKNKITILWISNFKFHQKQPFIFVELAKHFKLNSNLKFIMIGGVLGDNSKYEKFKSEIDKVDNIEYLGRLNQDQISKHLNKSQILVNTSLYEGFPNTFVQAWLRKVVVVSLFVNPDEILTKNEIGFYSGSFKNLVNDIHCLSSDKELLKSLGERSYQYAIKHHTIGTMVKSLLSVF